MSTCLKDPNQCVCQCIWAVCYDYVPVDTTETISYCLDYIWKLLVLPRACLDWFYNIACVLYQWMVKLGAAGEVDAPSYLPFIRLCTKYCTGSKLFLLSLTLQYVIINLIERLSKVTMSPAYQATESHFVCSLLVTNPRHITWHVSFPASSRATCDPSWFPCVSEGFILDMG